MSEIPGAAARLAENRDAILSRITAACARVGRNPSEVEVIWVSKTHPVATILEACDEAGARIFGENRVQEALAKFPLPPRDDGASREYELHLIGSLQRNKIRKILPLCTTIHSVDSMELWEALERVAEELDLHRRVFLQVNTSREPNKSGLDPDGLLDALGNLPAASHLDLVGLMTMGPLEGGPEAARPGFRRLADLLRAARARFGGRFPLLSKLSMGMSGDFEVAVEEGAHYVRVGTALFGTR